MPSDIPVKEGPITEVRATGDRTPKTTAIQGVRPSTGLGIVSPSSPVLRELQRLTYSSPNFHNKLRNALYGKEYKQCLPNLGDDDLAWLVEYLDNVRSYPTVSTLNSGYYRPSMSLNLRVSLSGNVYTNSEEFVVLGQYSQHPMRFHPIFWKFNPNRSLPEILVMCTRGPLTDQVFALRMYEYIHRMVQRMLLKYALELAPFLASTVYEIHRHSAKRRQYGNVWYTQT